MRSRWAVLAAALVAAVGTLLATTTAPRALAENNGLAVSAPVMGWCSWSFLRSDPTAAKIDAEAGAMKTSGLGSLGYDYVNLDDFWIVPGQPGPDVDPYGRWVTDATKFPASGSVETGIAVVANYVHTGPEVRPVRYPRHPQARGGANPTIEGDYDTAARIATSASENNYNCGGMDGINYSAPGAQAFIDCWADEFASWGVDYVKLDGVGSAIWRT